MIKNTAKLVSLLILKTLVSIIVQFLPPKKRISGIKENDQAHSISYTSIALLWPVTAQLLPPGERISGIRGSDWSESSWLAITIVLPEDSRNQRGWQSTRVTVQLIDCRPSTWSQQITIQLLQPVAKINVANCKNASNFGQQLEITTPLQWQGVLSNTNGYIDSHNEWPIEKFCLEQASTKEVLALQRIFVLLCLSITQVIVLHSIWAEMDNRGSWHFNLCK